MREESHQVNKRIFHNQYKTQSLTYLALDPALFCISNTRNSWVNGLSNSYNMVCPPVCGDNQVALCQLHQWALHIMRYFMLKLVGWYKWAYLVRSG